MSEIFSSTQRYELWLRIELIVTQGWAEIGEIPKSAIERLRHATVDAEHIARLEERVGHDVVAFLDSLAESVGDDARYLHRGLTSSDILDTALALQLVRAADILLNDIDRLLSEIDRIRVPTLILVGDEDVAVPVVHSQRLHERIADSRLEIIPRAGHTSTVEEPTAVNVAITNFLGSLS